MRIIRTLKTILSYGTIRKIPTNSLVIFGSNGGTGSHIVNKALNCEKKVISLIRPKHKMESSSNHIIYKGDVTNFNDVRKIYDNNDIGGTIICLGGKTSEVGENMLTNGTKNIIESILLTNSSKKIAVVTSIGTGDSLDMPPFFFKILMNTILKDAFIDKNNQENLFLNGIGQNLDFTIVRPSGLTNDIDNNKELCIAKDGTGTISRKKVAEFCYDIIYNTNLPSIYKNKTVCITSI